MHGHPLKSVILVEPKGSERAFKKVLELNAVLLPLQCWRFVRTDGTTASERSASPS